MTEPTDDAEGWWPGHQPPPTSGAPGAGYSRPGYSGPPGHGQPPYGPPGYGPPGYGPPGYGPPGYPPPGYGPPGYGYPPPPPPPGRSPGGQPLASFGERLLAYLLDTAIITVADLILVGPPFAVLLLSLPTDNGSTDQFPGGWFLGWVGVEIWAFVCGFGITYVYFVELMWRRGQTVGKRVMNLRVVPLDPWASMTRGTAVKRWLIQCVAAGFAGFLSIIDGLWQLWDKPFQQTLHDKVARTVVVKVSP